MCWKTSLVEKDKSSAKKHLFNIRNSLAGISPIKSESSLEELRQKMKSSLKKETDHGKKAESS
jgi:muramidase (phage lysozyme)